jgi:hypothetical protein
MAYGVRVAVHHQKRILPAHQDKMGRIIAGPRGFGQEIGGARFFKVLKAPRRPQSFKLGFGKLHQLTSLEDRAAKSIFI